MDDLRISVENAKGLLDRGQAVFLDARSPEDWGRSSQRIPASVRLSPEQLLPRLTQWPRGASVVAYCT
jgi:hypothetical protein